MDGMEAMAQPGRGGLLRLTTVGKKVVILQLIRMDEKRKCSSPFFALTPSAFVRSVQARGETFICQALKNVHDRHPPGGHSLLQVRLP